MLRSRVATDLRCRAGRQRFYAIVGAEDPSELRAPQALGGQDPSKKTKEGLSRTCTAREGVYGAHRSLHVGPQRLHVTIHETQQRPWTAHTVLTYPPPRPCQPGSEVPSLVRTGLSLQSLPTSNLSTPGPP